VRDKSAVRRVASNDHGNSQYGGWLLTSGSKCAADDEKKQAPADPLDEAALQQAIEAFAKPGREHEQLQRLVGNWKTAGNPSSRRSASMRPSRFSSLIRFSA